MADNLADDAPLLEILERGARDAAVDLHAVDQRGHGDELVRGDFLVQAVCGRLFEDDGVVGLVLDCFGIVLVLDVSVLFCFACAWVWVAGCELWMIGSSLNRRMVLVCVFYVQSRLSFFFLPSCFFLLFFLKRLYHVTPAQHSYQTRCRLRR